MQCRKIKLIVGQHPMADLALSRGTKYHISGKQERVLEGKQL